MEIFKRKWLITVGILLLALAVVAAGCGNQGSQSASESGESKKGPITVSSKQFTEQLILGNIMKLLLEENGYEVDDEIGLGGTLVNRKALENDQVDMYMEYTGTGLIVHLDHEEVITDPEKVYDIVAEEDKEENNLIWLDTFDFDNTYTLLMEEKDAEELGIESISDLSKYVRNNPGKTQFGSNAEFYGREDGYPALEEAYDLQIKEKDITKMDIGLLYKALKEDEVDVTVGFKTDGRIEAYDLVSLKDDKQFFPAYNPAPVVREEVIEEYPELKDVFAKLRPELDLDTIRRLNYLVDIEEKSAKEVAKDWLQEEGLITAE